MRCPRPALPPPSSCSPLSLFAGPHPLGQGPDPGPFSLSAPGHPVPGDLARGALTWPAPSAAGPVRPTSPTPGVSAPPLRKDRWRLAWAQFPSSRGQGAGEPDVSPRPSASGLRAPPHAASSRCCARAGGWPGWPEATPEQAAWLTLCPMPPACRAHRTTTPWCSRPTSRTAGAGWCCCRSGHMASPARGRGRWR